MFNSKIALAKNFRQNYTIDKNRNLKAVNNDDPWNNSASENEAIVNPLDSDTYIVKAGDNLYSCLLYTSPSPRDRTRSRMPSSA